DGAGFAQGKGGGWPIAGLAGEAAGGGGRIAAIGGGGQREGRARAGAGDVAGGWTGGDCFGFGGGDLAIGAWQTGGNTIAGTDECGGAGMAAAGFSGGGAHGKIAISGTRGFGGATFEVAVECVDAAADFATADAAGYADECRGGNGGIGGAIAKGSGAAAGAVGGVRASHRGTGKGAYGARRGKPRIAQIENRNDAAAVGGGTGEEPGDESGGV